MGGYRRGLLAERRPYLLDTHALQILRHYSRPGIRTRVGESFPDQVVGNGLRDRVQAGRDVSGRSGKPRSLSLSFRPCDDSEDPAAVLKMALTKHVWKSNERHGECRDASDIRTSKVSQKRLEVPTKYD